MSTDTLAEVTISHDIRYNPEHAQLRFYDEDKLCCTVDLRSGKAEFHGGYKPDAIAKIFWACITAQLPKAIVESRIKAAFSDAAPTAVFASELEAAGARPPWDHHNNDPATLGDASGINVVQIDPDVERTDEEVAKLAGWVLVAVNTCAGFKAARAET